MRVLVATSHTQGERPDDYCWTIEGELVRLPLLECDSPDCGCSRGFPGVTSHKATTTAMVVDRPDLDPASYVEILVDDAVACSGGFGDPDDPELRAEVRDEARLLVKMAETWPVDSVVQREGATASMRLSSARR